MQNGSQSKRISARKMTSTIVAPHSYDATEKPRSVDFKNRGSKRLYKR